MQQPQWLRKLDMQVVKTESWTTFVRIALQRGVRGEANGVYGIRDNGHTFRRKGGPQDCVLLAVIITETET